MSRWQCKSFLYQLNVSKENIFLLLIISNEFWMRDYALKRICSIPREIGRDIRWFKSSYESFILSIFHIVIWDFILKIFFFSNLQFPTSYVTTLVFLMPKFSIAWFSWSFPHQQNFSFAWSLSFSLFLSLTLSLSHSLTLSLSLSPSLSFGPLRNFLGSFGQSHSFQCLVCKNDLSLSLSLFLSLFLSVDFV